MINDIVIFLGGVMVGIGIGGLLQHNGYRKTLLLCAKAGTAEQLPDGKFYYIVEESAGE